LLKKHRQKIRRLWSFYYGSFVALIIVVSAAKTNPGAWLLTLPILVYFTFGAVRQTLKNRLFRLKYSSDLTQPFTFDSKFSLARFLLQPNFAFRLSLVLLLFTILTTMVRIHA